MTEWESTLEQLGETRSRDLANTVRPTVLFDALARLVDALDHQVVEGLEKGWIISHGIQGGTGRA